MPHRSTLECASSRNSAVPYVQIPKLLLAPPLDISEIRSTVLPGKVAVSPHDRPEGVAAHEAATRGSKRSPLFPAAHPAANVIPQWLASTPEEVGALKEVTMFQMIDQHTADPADRKMLLYKIGLFIVALAAVSGVIFLCVRSLV